MKQVVSFKILRLEFVSDFVFRISKFITVMGLGLAMILLVGCGSNKRVSDFETPDDVVQKALATALTAWQNGQPPTKIDGPTPIQVFDMKWQNGDKLKSFEILGEEESPTEGASRWFSVKLTAPNGQDETVRYVLVGKESILLFREEDYGRTVGMEGGFPKKKRK
jgi:hypothetical protein